MLIIADENIPAVHEAFTPFGEVRTLHGRHMTADDVCDADVLLVRSITRVDAALLSGSRVKFVGSATIGTDHVDLEWLAGQGIEFSNAPACNAISAAEYVLSALFTVSDASASGLIDKTVGIIGCGNVGSRVMARMRAIGLQCLVCDPPRAEAEGQSGFVSMQELASADIISVHVPLVKEGRHATRNLINREFIESLPEDCLFINTSRGDVVDEAALKDRLLNGRSFRAILDVWNNEPVIDTELAGMVDIATPHIAGYSIDGKLRATQMLYHALCKFTGSAPQWDPQSVLPKPEQSVIIPPAETGTIELVRQCLHHVYDVRKDDADLRETFGLPDVDRGEAFDQLRKGYAPRRECSAYQVEAGSLNDADIKALTTFEFAIKGI
ncbi:MAG: 4-phosphoerythronate dehydrogenase PdxB [Gammaproteobacteria bacterium]|nr:4-phosphoerythronate dehydrogenase PdxB [Gammaproteobacteria bacterium]